MEFTIKMQAEQINVVLSGLDELPHKVSRRTLDHILQQVQAQEAAAKQPAAAAEAAPQAPEAPADAGLND